MADAAILLTSFGSAYDKIRATTLDALATELEKKFPAFEIRQAFTSNFMIRKLARREIFIATPAEEISHLRDEGCRKIFLLPTHLTPGEEFDNKIKPCAYVDLRRGEDLDLSSAERDSCSPAFKAGAAPDVEIIPPLLSEPLDKKIFATILDCYPRAEDEDLVLIGHGSPNRHNPVYENLQRLAGDKVHIGVIEATDTPNFDDVVKRLKISRAEKILLAPLLFNGGVHVAEDIAGDDSGSWLNRLTALGYKVRVIRDGLGTFENFRKLYIDRLEEKIGRTQT